MEYNDLLCHSDRPETTADLARMLAPNLTAGDTILLRGDVGAGKTHFARALIQSLLAMPEDVPSPTFTLVQTYETADGTEIWHSDLYRLTHPEEVDELGLTDAFETAICLVECAEPNVPRHPDKLRPASVSTRRWGTATRPVASRNFTNHRCLPG